MRGQQVVAIRRVQSDATPLSVLPAVAKTIEYRTRIDRKPGGTLTIERNDAAVAATGHSCALSIDDVVV